MKARDLAAAFVLVLVALTLGSGTPAASADAPCPPTKAFFYTTDTTNLANRLGANKSDCADYFVSISPIVAAGPNFGEPRDGLALTTVHNQGLHALAELRPTQWEPYAALHGWYATGVKLHDDMIDTGYKPAAGDTWAINEVGTPTTFASTFPTDVFNGVDDARQHFREFVHGLHDGSGRPGYEPTMQGVVFAANPPQLASNVADYAQKLAAWYSDGPFWQDMDTYVGTWAQETYADVRAWGVADKPLLPERTAYLNDYFLHGLRVADQGGDATTAARTFLEHAYVPLANAAHRWLPPSPAEGPGFGSTDIPVDGMQRFISAQTYAQRSAIGTRLGFAVVPHGDTDTPAIEARVAAAIRDSQSSPIGACTAPGESCDYVVPDAAFTNSWTALDTSPPDLTCTPPPSTWKATDVSIACGASDGGSGLADQADASFDLSTSVQPGTETANASTDTHSVCDRAGNCATAGPIDGIKIDEKGPSLNCDTAPTSWKATNVTIPCKASDGGSGLVNSADANFSLTTNVQVGTETANASTDTRSVCDTAGNCATAGPIDGIKIDEKGPSLDCGLAPTFLLNQAGATVTAAVADAGSGVAASSVSAAADTSAAGSHTVDLTAADNVGNSTTASCPYSVGYALSGFGRPIANTPTVNTGKAGRTYPVKWQLQDANSVYISTLTAVAQIVIQPTACDDFATDPDSTLTVTATGTTSLHYDSAANQYVYNWATPSTAGCYTLFAELDSGQTLPAYFQLS